MDVVLSGITCREGKPRSTKSFHVDVDRCTSCRTCEQVCHTNVPQQQPDMVA
jgi:formate hydrogenlyase subunit 6/NADH:ubiquinone oxidoreductase subunit I